MVRPLRIDYPDAVYHITNRGVNRQAIFFEDGDYKRLIDLLEQICKRMKVEIHGFCLMPNHYHLEITTPESNLSRSIQWLNQSYATYINTRHQRSGHLFQGRFKSVIIEAESHLTALTRYIHQNPVRAGMVLHPQDYKWSSYRGYLGMDQYDWLNSTVVLEKYGKTLEEQRKNYREFVEEGAADNPVKEMVYGAILGSEKFVEEVQRKLKSKGEDSEISQLNAARRIMSIESIVTKMAKDAGTDVGQIKRKGGKRNFLREIAIYLCYMNSNKTNREIGEYFGGLDTSSVSVIIRRFKEKLVHNKILRDQFKSIQRVVLK